MEFLRLLFDTSGFHPRWQTGEWSSFLGWLHITSDLLIFGAYFAIPLTLGLYVASKKREIAFPRLYWLFAVFILFCGVTFLVDAAVFWHPWNRFLGLVKALTGVVSWATVFALVKVMPRALMLPGAARLNAELSQQIAERERSERALQEFSARLSLAMEHAGLGDWTWDARTDECRFSPRAASILGLPPGGTHFWQHLRISVPEEDLLRMANNDVPVTESEVGLDLQFRFRRLRDGELVWVQIRGKVEYEKGRPLGATGILQDVSQGKNTDLERERLLLSESRARAEAERANTMKDEFLATLSHELRTPLNAIQSWCHVIRDEPTSTEHLEMGLGIIERNCKIQAQLIEDLLDTSRIVSGKVKLDVQQVDLAAVLRGALETVQPTAERKKITLTSQLDPAVSIVRGDPARLQQVAWNLLTNALKFTPEGGSVTVTLQQHGDVTEFRVADTGVGIAPEFLPLVFDRFAQADASSTRRHGGLGLGLSIVKSLIVLHGGAVTVESPGLGQGSTFRVELPALSLPEEAVPLDSRGLAADASSAITGPSLREIRILIVDDETDSAEALKVLFATRGAVVSVASGAAAALELLSRDPFDVLISDLGMPEMDGYDLIAQIRARDAEFRQIPAVALSAFARTEDRSRAMMAGFDNYLPKPMEAEEILAVVARQAARVRGVELFPTTFA